jgi:hypothetical protein
MTHYDRDHARANESGRSFIALVEIDTDSEGEENTGWVTFDSIATSVLEQFGQFVNGRRDAVECVGGLLLLRARLEDFQQPPWLRANEGAWVELLVDHAIEDMVEAEVVLFGAVEDTPPIVGLKIVGRASLKHFHLLNDASMLSGEPRMPATMISAVLDMALHTIEPKKLAVAAYDVGQGNCNAIVDNFQHPLVFFDLGWAPNFHAKTRPEIRPDFFNCDSDMPAPVVLSHWDMDHWCYAIEKSIFDWRTFTTSHEWSTEALRRFWIARAPAAGTHKIGPLTMAFHAALKASPMGPWPGALLLWPEKVKRISFCAGWVEACEPPSGTAPDRNNTGLAMFVRPTPRSASILLTGDADFQSIPSLNGKVRLAGMVAPHHGAHVLGAHVPAPEKRSPARLVMSVGLNNVYGHPKQTAIDAYTTQNWVMSSTLSRKTCSCSAPGSKAHSHGSTLIPFRKGRDPKCGCKCVPIGNLCLLPSGGKFAKPSAGVKPAKKAKATAATISKTTTAAGV